MRVRLYPGEALGFRTLAEGSMIFSPRACDTYFLDSVATEGVLCLKSDWMDEADYRATLATKLGVDDDELMSRYVARLIVQFEAAGFLEVESA